MPKGDQFNLVDCKGDDCQSKIIFAIDPTGRIQVLHPRPPVYRVWNVASANGKSGVCCEKIDEDIFVSHFATCRNVGQIRGK